MNKKNKTAKRIMVIIIIVIAILLAMLKGYIKLEEYKRTKALGNGLIYDISNLEKSPESVLNGKTILFLGSSVTYGASAEGQSFVELFEYQNDVNVIKEAVSGTTLVEEFAPNAFIVFGNGESYVTRLKKIDQSINIDCLVCQLSTNDATTKKELGQVSKTKDMTDFDTKTVTGAMEYIIGYASETWNCPVVFYTGAYYEDEYYQAMVDRLYELQDKWGIGIIDLYSDADFNAIDADTYNLYMYDKIHPTKAGYAMWWKPEMEKQLIDFLKKRSEL